MNERRDHVIVMGAGAIGTLLGAYLQIGGKAKVSFVGRGSHIDFLQKNELSLEFPNGSITRLKVDAYQALDEIEEKPDWIIFTVRTYQTDKAMRQIVKRYGTTIPVVSFQNGLAIKDVATFVGENAVGGEALISSLIVSPGTLRQGQITGLYIGELSGKISDRANRMRAAFDAFKEHFKDIEVHATTNILGAIWAKLLINATNNTLSAVTDLSVRQTYENEKTQRYSYGLVTEILRLAKRENIDIYNTPIGLAKAFIDHAQSFEAWKRYLEERAPCLGHFKLSMSDMLNRGIKTEVDHINGYIVQKGCENGEKVPYNEALLTVVHKIERGELERGLQSLPPYELLADIVLC